MASACIKWALKILPTLGYSTQNIEPETILHTPWSYVCRFTTTQGYCYLKQVPSALLLEIQVIKLLRQTCGASVPLLIADNAQERCFLMQDAGIPLREFFKQSFDDKLLLKAIQDYIAIQRRSLAHLPNFLRIGVPDWRLTRIPEHYSALIQQQELLMADGLTPIEVKQLSKLTPKLISLCQQLSRFSIPDTLSHSDFHENNILIDPKTRKITFVDLGEVTISHPFFSLLNILHRVKENCALEAETYQFLQEQALQSWHDYLPQEQLLEAMSLIQQTWSIDALLAEYRLLTSIDATSRKQLLGQGRLAKKFWIWLAQ